ncbi:MAG TPA: hypothetical protein VIK01_08245 [Polyangiaceae bacterium]
MKADSSRRLGGLGALLIAGLGGCGPTIEAGFANAPSARRSSPPRKQHDAISNGPESCGRNQSGEIYRLPRCQQLDGVDAGPIAPINGPPAPQPSSGKSAP